MRAGAGPVEAVPMMASDSAAAPVRQIVRYRFMSWSFLSPEMRPVWTRFWCAIAFLRGASPKANGRPFVHTRFGVQPGGGAYRSTAPSPGAPDHRLVESVGSRLRRTSRQTVHGSPSDLKAITLRISPKSGAPSRAIVSGAGENL